MLTAETRRDNFYKRMNDELGLNRSEVVNLLKQNGHETFNADNITEYASIVKAHMILKLRIMDKLKQPISSSPQECPIPGCEGMRVTTTEGWNRKWWSCNVGGLRHAIVWRSAEIIVGRDADLEEVQSKALQLLKDLEAIDEAQKADTKTVET